MPNLRGIGLNAVFVWVKLFCLIWGSFVHHESESQWRNTCNYCHSGNCAVGPQFVRNFVLKYPVGWSLDTEKAKSVLIQSAQFCRFSCSFETIPSDSGLMYRVQVLNCRWNMGEIFRREINRCCPGIEYYAKFLHQVSHLALYAFNIVVYCMLCFWHR